VVGFTQDLERFYQGAVAFLAPILGGSGVRIKVLEAFRGGMPLVTTTAGALGLPIRHGEHAMVADTKEAYAKSVAELCQSSALQRRLRQGGYEYLKQFHSLQAAQGVMRQALGIS
jgi:glycosyltransferase involved in cell wall biosynthesis